MKTVEPVAYTPVFLQVVGVESNEAVGATNALRPLTDPICIATDRTS